jgi:arsenite transporter
MIQALAYLARQGRQVLLAGLVLGVLAGLALPDLAGTLQKLVAPVVVTLLFLAVLRLGPEGVRAGLAGWRAGVLSVLALQLLLPCLAVGVLLVLQVEAIWAFGLVLVLAAAPISGSPNLAIMSGASAPTALRQLVMGTLLLPATALPVFLLMPGLGAPAEVFVIVLRLLAVIAAVGGLGLWLRASGLVTASARSLSVIDGCATLLLALIVIALMGAVGPALVQGVQGWGLLLGVLVLGFGLQIATLLAAYGRMPDEQAAALGQVAGNRNIAFFLGVLPPALASDLMLFIGLYQIPMYLTPAVMGWVYARKGLRLG